MNYSSTFLTTKKNKYDILKFIKEKGETTKEEIAINVMGFNERKTRYIIGLLMKEQKIFIKNGKIKIF